ncbi:MAG TPA: hypothetical protein PLR41_01910 [Alphaproteobacteria bacterium]|nr:hypothetical protein [Alphaproteobacteria bacterium]
MDQADGAAIVGAMLRLSDKWGLYLSNQPETGMGYCIASVYLSDGRIFEDVVIDSGHITRIGYSLEIPFVDADIEKIVVTHGTKFRRGFWNKPILQDRET